MRRGLSVLAGLLLFTLGATVVNRELQLAVKPYRIPSSAMEPTLRCARPASGCEQERSDRILVLRFHPFWTPGRGEIVVFHPPAAAKRMCGAGGTFVKRLIGLPGETVSVRDGSIVIDGRSLSEPYIERGRRATRSGTWHVPEDAYFLLGDNRNQSCDSLAFGSVPRGIAWAGFAVAVYGLVWAGLWIGLSATV